MDSGNRLHLFAILLAFCTLLLIFAGGMVTSTGSGLAVPDWPLSYGQFFPEMVGGVFYEHGHRMVAATVGFLTVVFALWLWRSEERRWLRRLGGIAVLVVLLQGILGGITVLLRLPTAVSVFHAALAQLFFCITVAMALGTSRSWQGRAPRIRECGSAPSLRTLSLWTTAVIYLQILIGALMRHTGSGLAIPDFPLSYGGLIPPFFTRQILIHFLHRIGAVAVVVLVAWLAYRVFRGHPNEIALRRAASFLLGMLSVQIFLGAETIWSSRGEIVTTLHVAGGAATLAGSLTLTLWAHRILLPAAAPPHAAPAPSGVVTEHSR